MTSPIVALIFARANVAAALEASIAANETGTWTPGHARAIDRAMAALADAQSQMAALGVSAEGVL